MEEIRQTDVSSTRTTINTALIVFFILVVLTFAFEAFHVDQRSPIQYSAYLPFILGLIYSIKTFRDKDLGGFITISQGFKTGFRYTMFIALFMAIFFIIYLKFISPDLLEKGLTEAENKMLDQGKSTAEIEKGMGIARKYGPFFGAMGTFIVYVLLGSVISIIAAAILKKNAAHHES